eukprot:1634463-Pyramimonas_sp.AAC.1
MRFVWICARTLSGSGLWGCGLRQRRDSHPGVDDRAGALQPDGGGDARQRGEGEPGAGAVPVEDEAVHPSAEAHDERRARQDHHPVGALAQHRGAGALAIPKYTLVAEQGLSEGNDNVIAPVWLKADTMVQYTRKCTRSHFITEGERIYS